MTREQLLQQKRDYYKRNRKRLLRVARQYAKRNKPRVRRWWKEARARKRAYLDRAKARPCADCGIQYAPWVMDFDHIRDKEYNVSRMLSKGFVALRREIDKCEVVCANCHRERTHKRRAEGWAGVRYRK